MDDAGLQLTLTDGRHVWLPWDWFPILRDATSGERAVWTFWPGNLGLVFPSLGAEVLLDDVLRLPNPIDPVDYSLSCILPADREDVAAALVWHIMRDTQGTVDDAWQRIKTALERRPPVK